MINVKMYLAGEEIGLFFGLIMKLVGSAPVLYAFLALVGLPISH